MDESNWLLEVLEAMPDGVVIADQKGVMLLVNRELERITGYDRTELLGKAVEMLIPSEVVVRHEGHREGFHSNPHRLRTLTVSIARHLLIFDCRHFNVDVDAIQ